MGWTGAYCLALIFLAATFAGCAKPIHKPATTRPAPATAAPVPPLVARPAGRPTVGVAFGGGSARGIAHVGVIRWLEEHRIPIDAAAGTSMGGLIGGAFASGMDAAELETFITSLDWDQLFGASSFAHKNIRRKADARAYPSRLEFGLRGGIVPPTALNNGEEVELLLGRIAAPYCDIEDFDDLPTPFRTVAVDLLSAQPVVMRRGSLADAMRATMSLPLIFPPVEVDGQVLIDGGDHEQRAGRRRQGDGRRPRHRDQRRRSGRSRRRQLHDVRRGGEHARRHDARVDPARARRRGRRRQRPARRVRLARLAARRRSDRRGLPGRRERCATSCCRSPSAKPTSRRGAAARQARRKTELPAPAFVELDGFAASDEKRLNALLARHVGAPLDVDGVEQDIATVAGLDRYQTVTWRLITARRRARGFGLRVQGRVKPYAPPFMMLGVNLENTTSSDFRITLTARYLAFDVVGSGSELRLDGTIGSDPSVAIELYRPIGPTPLFVAPYAGVGTETFNLIEDDAVIARYEQTVSRLGFNRRRQSRARAATCASARTSGARRPRSRLATLASPS